MSEIIEFPTPKQRAEVYRIYKSALQRGELVKASACAWCGAEECPIDGHHPDYARPLMVVWLCQPCHRRHHREYAKERVILAGLAEG